MKNSKKTLLLALTSALVMAGCATNKTVAPEQFTEPLLIGGSIDQKIMDLTNEVKGQLALLVKLQQKEGFGPAQVVKHNQNLDARTEEEKPNPQMNMKMNVQNQIAIENKNLPIVIQPIVISSDRMAGNVVSNVVGNEVNNGFGSKEWNTRVNIKWKKGVDLLITKVAQTVGYTLIVRPQPGVPMKNVDLSFEDETLAEVIKKISVSVDSFADVAISHKNKTITLIYR